LLVFEILRLKKEFSIKSCQVYGKIRKNCPKKTRNIE